MKTTIKKIANLKGFKIMYFICKQMTGSTGKTVASEYSSKAAENIYLSTKINFLITENLPTKYFLSEWLEFSIFIYGFVAFTF